MGEKAHQASERTIEFTVRKKMAAADFTTIASESYIANRHVESPLLAKFVPILTTMRMLDLELLELFCAFLCLFEGFSYAKNYG